MKKYLALFLLICSCSQLNITEHQNKNTFNQLMRENFYDTDLALRKVDIKVKDVKIVKVKELPDLLSTMASLSSELQDRKATHYSYFSSQYKFIVDVNSIKQLAKENNCDVVLYLELNDVENFKLHGNRRAYKINRSVGDHFFNAVFYCKVDPHYSINMDKSEEE